MHWIGESHQHQHAGFLRLLVQRRKASRASRRSSIHQSVTEERGASVVTIAAETLAWMPTARKWLQEHADRFSAPVGLLPEGVRDVQVKQIVKGNMYCLTFRKP